MTDIEQVTKLIKAGAKAPKHDHELKSKWLVFYYALNTLIIVAVLYAICKLIS